MRKACVGIAIGTLLLPMNAAAQYGSPPPAGYGQPAPTSTAPQPTYQQPYREPPAPGSGSYREPPAPPPPPARKKSPVPPISLRIDPLNWLLSGRLGVEAEVGLHEYVSFELVPIFVVNDSPPTFGNRGSVTDVTQHSNGWGSMAGARFGAGFWLNGTPMRGNVIRLTLLNAGYRYDVSDDVGKFDEVKFTERRLGVMIGSVARWGAFTLAYGFGLSYALNDQRRCYASPTVVQTNCKDEVLEVRARRDGSEIADLLGGLHPFYIDGGLSLGVTLD